MATTPIVDQWQDLKAQHPSALLFFQLGDFYELLFEDAPVAAAALSLTLTRRGRHRDADIPMCGVPTRTAGLYIQRLLRAGFCVALADQHSDRASGEIRRSITRVETPATSLDDTAGPTRAGWLVALHAQRGKIAIATADVSRLRLDWCVVPADNLPGRLAQIGPREIIADTAIDIGALETRRVKQMPDMEQCRRYTTLRCQEGAGAPVIGLLLAYVAAMQGNAVAALIACNACQPDEIVAIDASTRFALGVLPSGTGESQLSEVLDRTRSPGGARLFRTWVENPIRDVAEIARRQALWRSLASISARLHPLRDRLGEMPDLERALARLRAKRLSGRDVATVARALSVCRELTADGVLSQDLFDPVEPLTQALTRALGDIPATEVQTGFDPALDAVRVLARDRHQALAVLQAQLAQDSGIGSLKIRHHAQFGYVAEVGTAQVAALSAQPGYTLRQGLAGGGRFSHPAITSLGDAIATAADEAASRETALIASLAQAIAETAAPLSRIGDAVAELDVAQGCATLSQEGVWCAPEVDASVTFSVRALRHPGVAAALPVQAAFVPNDCDLSPGRRLMLLTGPNMAGKSTFLRQNAIAVILAQAGLPVPAEAAHIGMADALFSRIGASDDLARGRSTFMVEMLDTAAILTGATDRSFVIIDEIGRGTATQDGLAIARAVLEALHTRTRCRGVFATHFLELAGAAAHLPRVHACAMRVRETRHGVVFLHEVAAGAASRSWGIHVAALAGVPKEVVRRAAELLAVAERARPVQDLPLFAGPAMAEEPPAMPDPLQDALAQLDPDRLTPREALDALYALKRLAAPG